MEKETITYLLGAGASANCLPTVENMAEGILDVINVLRTEVEKHCNVSNRSRMKQVIDALEDLFDHCKNNHSIDTFAKKLMISGKIKEYEQLKNTLTLYFTLQQKIRPLDKRYDNFWAAFLSNKSSLPENIRVISWNYDSQLEISYQQFANTSQLEDAYLRLNMTSLRSHKDFFTTEKFSITKINGSAKYRINDTSLDQFYYLTNDYSQSFNADFFDKLLDTYEELVQYDKKKRSSTFQNELSFAWEHDTNSEFYTNLKLSLKSTTVLVVIGYSFPIYNRKIDKIIINDCMPNLKKVYLQAPDAEDLKERFLALTNRIDPNTIVLKKDKTQFVFPNELDI